MVLALGLTVGTGVYLLAGSSSQAAEEPELGNESLATTSITEANDFLGFSIVPWTDLPEGWELSGILASRNSKFDYAPMATLTYRGNDGAGLEDSLVLFESTGPMSVVPDEGTSTEDEILTDGREAKTYRIPDRPNLITIDWQGDSLHFGLGTPAFTKEEALRIAASIK